jgi:hypothetical protein
LKRHLVEKRRTLNLLTSRGFKLPFGNELVDRRSHRSVAARLLS